MRCPTTPRAPEPLFEHSCGAEWSARAIMTGGGMRAGLVGRFGGERANAATGMVGPALVACAEPRRCNIVPKADCGTRIGSSPWPCASKPSTIPRREHPLQGADPSGRRGPAQALLARLGAAARSRFMIRSGAIEAFDAIFGLDRIAIAGAYVQQIARIGTGILGRPALPVTELARSHARTILIAAFDAGRILAQMQPYLPADAEVLSLDALRIPEDRLTNRRAYLDPLNFATNFVFFRDANGLHTRLMTANYWSGYGAGAVTCWMTLFAGDGACWPNGARALRLRRARSFSTAETYAERFRLAGILPGSCSSTSSGRPGTTSSNTLSIRSRRRRDGPAPLSCTHDANAWPRTDMPACRRRLPAKTSCCGSRTAIRSRFPPRSIGLNRMGEERVVPIGEPIAPFATRAVDVSRTAAGRSLGRGRSSCAPASTWCARATKLSSGVAAGSRTSMSNAADLRPDPRASEARQPCSARDICCRPRCCRALCGKPWCCRRRWRCVRAELPIAALVYDPDGKRGRAAILWAAAARPCDRARSRRGRRHRGAARRLWPYRAGLRLLCRRRRPTAGCMRCSAIATGDSGHAAETSFGAHVFNTILTYRDEPQSYTGPPAGVVDPAVPAARRGWLRHAVPPDLSRIAALAPGERRRTSSSTTATGAKSRGRAWRFPVRDRGCGTITQLFDAATRARARARRLCHRSATPTCRLFGYHGLLRPRRRLQPRPHVRLLARRFLSACCRKNAICICEIRRDAACPSVTTARS